MVQSTCTPVNDNLMELLIMINAFKRASAGRVTAVIPYFGYARQDRKAKARDPISAKLVADLITAAGADRVLTIGKCTQHEIQGFFDIPVDHLLGVPIMIPHFIEKIGNEQSSYTIVSGRSVTRARKFAERCDVPLAIIDKRRPKANVSEVMNIIGDVRGRKVIIVDDMIDTAGTLCNAAKALVEIGGATMLSPVQPTAYCPAQLWKESRTASSKRSFCSTPFRCRRTAIAARLLAAGCSGFCRGNRAHLSRTNRFLHCLFNFDSQKRAGKCYLPFFLVEGLEEK